MLYKFEKYYLLLIAHKIINFLEKIFRYQIVQLIAGGALLMLGLMITVMIFAYFFIGVNVFLEKIHLEKYRIEEINFMNSKLDLKPFFKE